MREDRQAILYAVLAALLYALSTPLAKILLQEGSPAMVAAFLYLGAGIGMTILFQFRNRHPLADQAGPLTKKDLPYVVGMVVLDTMAPILLMLGLTQTNAATVALLNNFEIVATSVIALVIFKEKISGRLWLAIGLVLAASLILSMNGGGPIQFNRGALLVLLAGLCWGMENNCTRMISSKRSEQIVMIKGLGSGTAGFLIALGKGDQIPSIVWILEALALGYVAYGLSINFYIKAQKYLGAAKTSAYYSLSPFIGVLFSLFLLGERPNKEFFLALGIMGISTFIMSRDHSDENCM